MNDIITLDDDTVKKIAAGEVIERPASVVKELIENSLDANSTRIEVTVSNGGRKLIGIADNGTGMNRQNAEVCFKRYTTSKIRKIDDLDRLRTLGFRGEALASICAVSKVELTTKQKGALEGTRLLIEAGDLKDSREVGCPEGTTVVVKDLFFNLPARKRHLRSTRRELAHIVDVVTRYSLIRNDVFFSLDHDGKRIIESPPTKSILDCATNIFGIDVSKSLIPMEHDSQGIRIRGLVGKPHSTRSSSGMLYFYVNKRYVSSRLMSAAVREAYGTRIPKNRYPICVLSLEIDPERIDVNIHPTKLHVKFIDENVVYGTVLSAVKVSLESESLIPEAIPKKIERGTGKPIPEFKARARGMRPSRAQPLTIQSYRRRFPLVSEKATLPELTIIGDIDNTYILGESPRGIVVLDQHAAHERILYEKLLEPQKEAQELITPIALELTVSERTVLDDFEESLKDMGFDFEPFGKKTLKINSVPAVIGSLVSLDIIHDILSDLKALPKSPGGGVEQRIAETIAKKSAMVACKSAIKAGEKQSTERLERLVNELYSTSNPYTCPHGRPTMISITKEELEKRFLRT